MSWAADNPEKYDEICRRGITARIFQSMLAVGYNAADLDLELLEGAVLAIQEDPDSGKAYDGLLDWSIEQINEEEREHFAGLVDDAYERGKG